MPFSMLKTYIYVLCCQCVKLRRPILIFKDTNFDAKKEVLECLLRSATMVCESFLQFKNFPFCDAVKSTMQQKISSPCRNRVDVVRK